MDASKLHNSPDRAPVPAAPELLGRPRGGPRFVAIKPGLRLRLQKTEDDRAARRGTCRIALAVEARLSATTWGVRKIVFVPLHVADQVADEMHELAAEHEGAP